MTHNKFQNSLQRITVVTYCILQNTVLVNLRNSVLSPPPALSLSLYRMLLTAWQHLPIFAGCGDLAYHALERRVYLKLRGKSICHAQQSQHTEWIYSLTAATVNRHHSGILCTRRGELQNILITIASTLYKIQTGYFSHMSTVLVHKLWSSDPSTYWLFVPFYKISLSAVNI